MKHSYEIRRLADTAHSMAFVAAPVLVAIGLPLVLSTQTAGAQSQLVVFSGYVSTSDWAGNGAVGNDYRPQALFANGVYFTAPGPGYVSGVRYVTGAKSVYNANASAIGHTHRFAVVPAGTDPASAANSLLGQGAWSAVLSAEQVRSTGAIFTYPGLSAISAQEVSLSLNSTDLPIPAAGNYLLVWTAESQNPIYDFVFTPESRLAGGLGYMFTSWGLQQGWNTFSQITHSGTPAINLTFQTLPEPASTAITAIGLLTMLCLRRIK